MEDLLVNFIEHIGKHVSNELGMEIKNYVEEMTKNLSNTNTFDNDNYEQIEHGVKGIISNYLKNCRSEIFLEISQNLYNEYIVNDDSNLIRTVKYFVRVYSKFEEIKMKKLFYRWRINILYSGNKNVNLNSAKPKNLKIMDQDKKFYSNKENNQNDFSKINKLDKINDQTKYSNKNLQINKNDIFNKLYMDSLKKQDERLLKDELKKISELEECTFRPKISKNLS